MLNRLFTLSSVANVLGGAVLFLTWAVNWISDPGRHVPLIVLAIGLSMLIQGFYSAGYALGWWKGWGEMAPRTLLAGQLIFGCAGLGLLIIGLISNSRNADQEMAPVLAGLMIGVNALLALVALSASGKLPGSGATPPTRARGAA